MQRLFYEFALLMQMYNRDYFGNFFSLKSTINEDILIRLGWNQTEIISLHEPSQKFDPKMCFPEEILIG